MTAEDTTRHARSDVAGVVSVGEVVDAAGVRQCVMLGEIELWSRPSPRRRREAEAGAALAHLRRELQARTATD